MKIEKEGHKSKKTLNKKKGNLNKNKHRRFLLFTLIALAISLIGVSWNNLLSYPKITENGVNANFYRFI